MSRFVGQSQYVEMFFNLHVEKVKMVDWPDLFQKRVTGPELFSGLMVSSIRKNLKSYSLKKGFSNHVNEFIIILTSESRVKPLKRANGDDLSVPHHVTRGVFFVFFFFSIICDYPPSLQLVADKIPYRGTCINSVEVSSETHLVKEAIKKHMNCQCGTERLSFPLIYGLTKWWSWR